MYFSSPIRVLDYVYLRDLRDLQKMVSHNHSCPIIHAVSAYQKNVSIPYRFEPVFNQMVCIVGGVGTLYKENKNIKNVKRCRDGMPKSMQTRQG